MLITITAVSYGIAALAFALLTVLQLTRWRHRAHAALLVVGALGTAAWAGNFAWHAWWQTPGAPVEHVLEFIRAAGWAAFLLSMMGILRPGADWRALRSNRLLQLAAITLGLFAAVAAVETWAPSLLEDSGLALVVLHAMIAVMIMILVEQAYRNKTPQERWAIKYACMGIGGMFVYDFYLYADAMLFRRINPDIWAARGFVQALTMPLIAIGVSRSDSWSSALSVSRRILFHSVALGGSAAYLLAMSTAGYYLRYFGGNWGSVMQVAFVFGAIVLLAALLFSGTSRAWLKVFISKHFYTYNYDYREEWLRFTRMLSQEGPGLGERTIQAVAGLVESPGGAVWLRRDSGAYEPLAQYHCPVITANEPGESSFCQFLATRQWVVDVDEYRRDGELYDGITLPEWLQTMERAWLVVPLMLQGRLFGFMLLLQPRSAVQLNWEVIDLLKVAGSQAASYLAQQEAATALMLARQFESFNRMSTFVVHDLKNLVAQLSLLIPNAHKHRNNPEFQQDMLDTVTHSVQKMKLMLQKLSRNDAPERPVSLPIDQLLQQAVSLKAAFEPRPVLQVQQPGLRVVADWERLERVLGHLIQNAIEATPKDGSVNITLGQSGNAVLVEISDTGQGMTEEFIRDRLFKPFESTKPAGMGIGAFESREYIHELGGRLDVSSTPQRGTTFRVTLPMYVQDAQAA
ncbi:PEP-CTERM system histidine kinase PrsK [Pseudoduganella ginsengisoli]|uniref:histidine kinase n=1 Tax=Pseudoduganella ginsengisoli TaxID=1462440 RepID=A0A6L6PZH1_9BURK|nr:XrtA/PEP-CTERM system histidine kinase PrsK [Pseudoduganella ginsengisoli]MTW02564.1 PEP-CTERM system histidine kinase PrsK [Pseudoduganella ginsengisoli]